MLRQGKPSARKAGKPPAGRAKATEKATWNQVVTEKGRPGWIFFLVGALLILAFLIQGVGFLLSNSQTSDEAVHLAAGYSYISRGDFRLNPEHPPFIKEVCALSVLLSCRLPFEPAERLWSVAEEWRIGRNFLYGSSAPWQKILFAGRLPNLLLGAVLIGIIGWWARRLWGDAAGLTAMALAAFEPYLIANSCLITTDLG